MECFKWFIKCFCSIALVRVVGLYQPLTFALILVAVDDDDLELLVVQIKVGHLDAVWDKDFNFVGYLFIHPRICPKQDKANPTYFGVHMEYSIWQLWSK